MKICNECKRKHPDEVEVCDCGSENLSKLVVSQREPIRSSAPTGPVAHHLVLTLCRWICGLAVAVCLVGGILSFCFGLAGWRGVGVGDGFVTMLLLFLQAILAGGMYYVFLVVEDYLENHYQGW